MYNNTQLRGIPSIKLRLAKQWQEILTQCSIIFDRNAVRREALTESGRWNVAQLKTETPKASMGNYVVGYPPPLSLSLFLSRAFPVAGPQLWNSLPSNLYDSLTLPSNSSAWR